MLGTLRSRLLTSGAVGAVSLAMLSGCAPAARGGDILLAGTTRADLITLSAPQVSAPPIDVTVGISKTQTAATANRRAASTASYSQQRTGPVPAGLLRFVAVRPGATVRKGQLLAAFDARMLELGVLAAQASYRKVNATADTLVSSANDLRDKRATVRDQRALLRSQRALLEDTLAKLRAALPQLTQAIAQMKAGRAAAQAKLDELKQQLAKMPPGSDTTALKKAIAALAAQIAGLDAQIAKFQGDLAKAQAGLPKLVGGVAKMKAADVQIANGLVQMSDAIQQLDNASDVTRIAAKGQAVAVDLARYAVTQARLISPVDGVVVSAMPAGQIPMAGAPVIVIRPNANTLVDAYVDPADIARVRTGEKADVSLDSVRGVLEGKVWRVWPDEEFPPSNYPTTIVHLSRVVRVTVAVPDKTLPLGVPADVVIHAKTRS